MLINTAGGDECRIAIMVDGKLEEFYQERASAESHVSNIYKGRVQNVEPAIQAAFVDFGLERNGFLHISDLHPKYFPGKDREEFEKVGIKTPRRDRPPIQKCLKRGQEVMVQVLKEGIGTKGPTLTSYLSIPGRFVVMMPDMKHAGVSRKVDDDEQRKEARELLKSLDPPDGFGFIVRTAGIGQTKTDLKRDLAYLVRLWKAIDKKRKQIGKTGELYSESDLMIRTIRDVFTTDVERIVVDDLDACQRAADFVSVCNPRGKTKVEYYEDPVPLFHRMAVEPQIDQISAREVPLPSGGSLVFDQTEAMVAIDVNSGKSRSARDAETNAYETNKEAVEEIARQLRLRDLGGVIAMDLIDMMAAKRRKSVEQQFRNALKRDRARTRVGTISQFGVLEMTRQRMRPSLKTSIYRECEACGGRGHTFSVESVVLSVMRRLALVMHRDDVARIELTVSPDTAFQLLNRRRTELTHLEENHDVPVLVRVGGSTVDHLKITAYDRAGQEVLSDAKAAMAKLASATKTTFRELDHPSLKGRLKELRDNAEADDEFSIERIEVDDEDDDRDAGDKKDDTAGDADDDTDQHKEPDSSDSSEEGDDEDGKPKRRRRRRRGGRRRRKKSDGDGDDAQGSSRGSDGDDDNRSDDGGSSRDGKDAKDESDADTDKGGDEKPAEAEDDDADQSDDAPKGGEADKGSGDGDGDGDGDDQSDGDHKPRRRRRRGGRRRRKSGSGSASGNGDGPGDGQGDGRGDGGGDGRGDDAGNKPDSKSDDGSGDKNKKEKQASDGYSNRLLDREPAAETAS